ncbi:hypothetical protein Aduo_007286 [Ancylostoma duodenale]
MRELDELDVLDVEITDDADSDEEAMGEKCITLLSSLLPSGSCLYPQSKPVAHRLTSPPSPEEERPTPTFAILSSAAEVEANCAANSDVDADDELTVEVLSPPEEHPDLEAGEGDFEVRCFLVSHSI